MITIVENAWKIQNKVESRLKKIKNQLPNKDTLQWRSGDFTVYLFCFVVSFGVSIFIIFNYITDWWILPTGLGFVFLFLFFICKKVGIEKI